MQKRIVSLLLVIVLLFSLTSCSKIKRVIGKEETTAAVAPTSNITIVPGMSVLEVAEALDEGNVCSKDSFIEACKVVPDGYDKLFDGIEESSDYIFAVEGYLIPNTYNMYQGKDGTYALKYLLNETQKALDNLSINGTSAYEKAEELNMSMFEVITLASIVQYEANLGSTDKDLDIMKNVASVFHNRLNDKTGSYTYLGSNATRKYIENKMTSYINENGLDYDKYFKAYCTDSEYDLKTKGLPKGPVGNPSISAIEATLWPNSTGYYFFFTDVDNGFHFYTNLKDFQYEWNTKYKH